MRADSVFVFDWIGFLFLAGIRADSVGTLIPSVLGLEIDCCRAVYVVLDTRAAVGKGIGSQFNVTGIYMYFR